MDWFDSRDSRARRAGALKCWNVGMLERWKLQDGMRKPFDLRVWGRGGRIALYWWMALCWLSALCLGGAGSAWAITCAAPTPEIAARTWVRSPAEARPAADATRQDGYAVQRVISDPVLGAQWALVVNCAHPERPPIAVALSGEDSRFLHQQEARFAAAGAASMLAGMPEVPRYVPVLVRLDASPVSAPASTVGGNTGRFTKISAPASAPVLVRAGDRVVLWNQEPQLRMEIEAVALEYGHAGQVIRLRRDGRGASLNVTMSGVVRGPDSVELMP